MTILQKARDSYADYFVDWFDNDLLLAATLLDPTQACQYFLSGRDGAVADMGKAWTSIETLARDLMAPPAQQAPGAAGVAAAVAVHVDLASLLAAAQGAPAGVAVPAGSLADEKASFMAFMSENYAKLAEEQLTALAFYKKFKSRIPKIAVV